MEEQERYKEPKKIGDIIHDIWLLNKDITPQSRIFSERLVQKMTSYSRRYNELHPFYIQASELITVMDNFCIKETENIARYKELAQQQQIKRQTIHQHMDMIIQNIESFEYLLDIISKKLRSIANIFLDPKDTDEHHHKINAFCSLFTQIYTDIDTLYFEYDQIKVKHW